MDIDWDIVKKQTLWSYEELVKKLLKTLDYGFVREYYDHSMVEAVSFAEKVQEGYLQGRSEPDIADKMGVKFKTLGTVGVKSYLDLVQRVENKGKCETFLSETGFRFEALIETLNYLLRWVLPFGCPVRELIDVKNGIQMAYLEILKREKLGANLDILERGRTQAGRDRLVKDTGIPEAFVTELVHKADISRLAYVRGKTVLHLCGGGYDTLEKIASADVAEMEQRMDAYYRTLGKSLADFKAVIPLTWVIGGARILPKIVDFH